MNLGENIKFYRKEKGFTQVQLAKQSNISRSYLADIENNRYNPSIDTLTSISLALGIKLNQLLLDDNVNAFEVNESVSKYGSEAEKFSPEVETIAAHLEGKDITPKKMKLIKNYIDALFDEE